jgi:hypothetical protein
MEPSRDGKDRDVSSARLFVVKFRSSCSYGREL